MNVKYRWAVCPFDK